MKKNWRTVVGYILFVAIAAGCGLLAYCIGPTLLGAIVAAPGAVSLAAIPWQLFRDQRAHERAIELSDRNSAIALGVGSPMAKAAFENYAVFAKAYADELSNVIGEIVREGPRGGHLGLSQRLSAVRREHSLWVTSETDKELLKLEDCIWKMAVAAGYTENAADRGQTWNAQYELAHRNWCELVGLKFEPLFEESQPADADQVVVNLQHLVMKELRRVLGTEDYSRIRSLAIARALALSGPFDL
ncbi:hypothetical protein [Dyella thiooxydans]|uniref:hypothetical protein n=1 Tax=Dyella thiooxydans TaxID=445710 RepID=UPI000A5C547D|nr:hypothetical protein [Dyella thiooxydans]